MRHFIIVTIICLVLGTSSYCLAADKFQLVTSPDGNVYRMDSTSGEVWIIKGDSMERVQSKEFRIKIGQQYMGEDLYSFKYMGKGQLGEVKTLDDFFIGKKK